MKRTLQISNILALVVTIFINYLSNTGYLNNTTIGDVSKSLNTLFTPAGYAFSIWGFIYLLLIGFIVYQSRSLFTQVKNDDFILKIGWSFVISCLANSAWVLAWIYGYTTLSCVLILILLAAILRIVIKTDMELWDAPISTIAFLWWPFTFYSGWITVASIANVSAVLKQNNWNGFGLSPITWTVIMIGIATAINLIVTWKRNMREFALVGAWALTAIAVANKPEQQTIYITAIIAAIILIISSGIHGFKNRSTNPFLKLKAYSKKELN
ncbi:tryptophan-rich sensory protein [Bizionia sp. KMM 8389]